MQFPSSSHEIYALAEIARRMPGSRILSAITSTDGKEVRIGKLLSLLSVGRIEETSIWAGMEVAAFLAVQDFNRRQSILSNDLASQTQGCNFFLTIDARDSEFKPMVAARQWQTAFLVENPTISPHFAVLGPMRSASSAVVANLGGNTVQTIPNISPASTSSSLDDKDVYPYFARTVQTDIGAARALCRYLQFLKVERLGVLYVNDSYGMSFLASIKVAAKEFFMSLDAVAYSDSNRETLVEAVAYLNGSKETYFFGIFSPSHWLDALTELANQRMLNTPRYHWIFSETMSAVYDLQIPISGGIELALALNRTAIITAHRPEPQKLKFKLLLEETFEGDKERVDFFLSLHSETLGDISAGNLLDYLVSAPTIYSMATYDAVIALGVAVCQADALSLNSSAIYDELIDVSFKGATGQVSFDSMGGRVVEEDQYEINNLLISRPTESSSPFVVNALPSLVVTGTGINATVTILRDIIFSDRTTTPPAWNELPSTIEEMNLVPIGVRAGCWALAFIAVLLSITCAIWTILNRKMSTVRASQPFFLVVLCVGTLLMGLSILPVTFQEPMSKHMLDAACMADMWLLSLGCSICFAALFSKTWRINQVYKNARRFRRVVIRPRHVAWPLLGLLTVNLTILITWTLIDPFEWVRVADSIDSEGNVTESRGVCQDGEAIFFYTLLLVNALALALSNYQSFLARGLPTEFNESAYLAFSNVAVLEALVIGLPVLSLVDQEPTEYVLTRSIIIAILCFGVLVPMFLPKLTYQHDKRSRRTVSMMCSRPLTGVSIPDPSSKGVADDSLSLGDEIFDVLSPLHLRRPRRRSSGASASLDI